MGGGWGGGWRGLPAWVVWVPRPAPPRAVWALGLVIQQAFTESPLCAELCTPGAPPRTRGLALPPPERCAGPQEAERARGELPQHAEGTLEAGWSLHGRGGAPMLTLPRFGCPAPKSARTLRALPRGPRPSPDPASPCGPPHRPHTVPKAGPPAAAQASRIPGGGPAAGRAGHVGVWAQGLTPPCPGPSRSLSLPVTSGEGSAGAGAGVPALLDSQTKPRGRPQCGRRWRHLSNAGAGPTLGCEVRVTQKPNS